MKTWIDFEERFRRLPKSLSCSRIDDQTGAAGEYWRIAGSSTNKVAVQEFETLCTITGRKISEVLKGEDEYAELLNHEDYKVRWYRLLKKYSPTYSRGASGYQIEEDGSRGWIHGGTIMNIAESSANLCLWLEANYPISQPWYKTLYEDYGREIIIGIVLIVISTIFAT